MGRPRIDSREATIGRLVEDLVRQPLGLHPPAACLLVADCLLSWIRHPRDLRRLERAWRGSLAFDQASRLPLFAPDSGESVPPELLSRIATELSTQTWTLEDGERLGTTFELLLNPQHRKSQGAFYTPREVVDYLLAQGLPPPDRPLPRDFRVLDPSCGAGNFLSVTLEALHARVWSPLNGIEGRFQRMERVLKEHLFGVDRDPWAVRLAQSRLRFVQARLVGPKARMLEANLLVLDTLKDHHPLLEPGFDLILGNPPYGADVPEDDRRFFQRHYALGRGRSETTALFLERSVRLLRSGGNLAMVVPHGVTRTGGYAATRRLLVETLSPRALLDCGAIFPGVNLEAIAFVCQKPRSSTRGGLPWAPGQQALVRLDSLREGNLSPVGTQTADFYPGRPTMPMYVVHPHGGWVERLERRAGPLQELAQLRRGAGISGREPALGRRAVGTPVVRGRDVTRYGAMRGLPRLHPHAFLRERLQRETLAEGRVGYQNIASSVVATWFPAGVLPLDTVNVVIPREEIDPLYLLGVLGSRLTDAYFQSVLANRARLTLHLDTPTLGPLPLIIPSAEEQRAIGELAERVLAFHRRADEGVLLEELGDSPHGSVAAFRKACEAAWHIRQESLTLAQADLALIDERLEALAGLSRAESDHLASLTGRGRIESEPKRRTSRWALDLIVRGCLERLESSGESWTPATLLSGWAHPDRDVYLEAWGGGSTEDLVPHLIRAGVQWRGGRLRTWEPGLDLVAT